MSALADNIKRLRLQKTPPWSAAELSRRCGKSVKMIEAGKRRGPRPETLEAIAKALDVTVADLHAEPEPRRKRSA